MPEKRSISGDRRARTRRVAAAASLVTCAASSLAVYPAVSAYAADTTPAAASLSPVGVFPAHSVLTRALNSPVPDGADALRISVLGDGSGAKVNVRLLASGGAPTSMDAYYASPDIVLDYKGWRTVVLPLKDFTYRSEESPETDAASLNALTALPTLDTVQLAINAAPACKVFFDDLAWAKAASAPEDAPLAVIDTFDSAGVPTDPTSWRLGGDYDQFRATTMNTSTVAAFVKNGQGSMQVTVQAPGYAEKLLYGPTLSLKLKQTPAQPYAVYVRPAFQPIRPDSTPSPQELAKPARLEMFACAGQTEPISFCVYSAADLKDATVKIVGPFLSESKQSSLPPSAIDVRVVRLGDGKPVESTAHVPELLMKDDRESLDGTLPTVRLTGDPTTDIPAGTSKQFWVTVNVPKDQFSAVYTGKLVFSAPGVKPIGIPLSVEIMPMRIKTAFLQYGIDLHSRLSASGGPTDDVVVTPETYAAELADVRDHGFRIVTIDEPLETLPQALKIYKDSGLSPVGPVILRTALRTKEDVKKVDAMRDTLGLGDNFDMYYALPDDLMAQCVASTAGGTVTSQSIPKEVKDYLKALQTGSRKAPLVVAPCTSRSSYGALCNVLDNSTLAPIFASTSDYTTTLLTTGKREIANRDYWSWNIARQSPSRNRMMSGFLLCKTGMNSSPLYGAFAGPYHHAQVLASAPAPVAPAPAPTAPGNATTGGMGGSETSEAPEATVVPVPVVNPTVPAEPEAAPAPAAASPEPATAAPAVAASDSGPTIGGDRVAYLVNGGVIDTIQWEGVRAGVDDVRYYGALKGYIRDLKDNHLRKDATDQAELYLSAIMKKPFRTLSPAEYQAMRRGIADQATKLLTILRSKIGDYSN